jgi:hypothetical protein
MYKYGDYAGYINSLKYKQLYALCRLAECRDDRCCDRFKNGCNLSSNNLYTDTDKYGKPITITTNTCITYIEPQLDVMDKPRIYNLEGNSSISNGTTKTIVNNIDITNNVFVQINCVNASGEGGFVIYNKRYKSYLFGIKGEPFELLWNQSLNAWTVLKYSNIFKE